MRSFGKTYRLLVFLKNVKQPFFGQLSGGLEISTLDIQFSVEKNLSKHPNTAEINIFNLSDDSRKEFEKRPMVVHLEAGYGGVNKLLFVGDVRPGSYSRRDGEWRTKLILGDGARAFSEAFVTRSYRPGTKAKTIVRDVAASMNLRLPKLLEDSPELDQSIATGETTHGYSSDELERLLAQYGFSWSMQNGKLQAIRFGQAVPGEALVISQASGMLGSPELGTSEKGKPPTLTVDHQLYPEIGPGRIIQLESVGVTGKNGLYKLQKVKHTGDTRGDEWNTKMEATPR